MNKYIAFLRGINISGKNKIDMSDLKSEFENAGFTNVSTYLNSGNVSFLSNENNLKNKIEDMIYNRFELQISVYVVEVDVINDILSNAPEWWNSGNKENYDNLIFILSDDAPETIYEIVGPPSEKFEKVQIYKNVIFWTFDRKKYQKCNWWKKTASNGIADKLTIRTANTVKKVCKSN
ncbi:MAG: DUF1697 domain-containing protein [Lachnospiraceae bacterium]|nr:DUF1697 domain-containing protein [Lachnospiraceae bacterium]